jgi:pimeloyl-ACP methyl ester carboxylesterase
MVIHDKSEGARRHGYAPFGTHMQAPKAKPGLYLVATPIGNLGDITLRALEVLAGADVIACEDTRVTRKLVDRFGIETPLTPYHDHNAATARPRLMARLAASEAVALVSDAGTPLISDPGYRLVREAQDLGFPVIAVPGASSVLTALSVAGLPTDRFFFEGFLPAKQAARQKRIAALLLIAPATDFTDTLLWNRLSEDVRQQILDTGEWLRPTAYGPDPCPITRELIEDGRKHLLLGGKIALGCPVRIVQGMNDPDVPWQHALTVVEALGPDTQITLVKDGDHRLSKPHELALIEHILASLVTHTNV